MQRILIIGGGLTGAALAWQLSRAGAKVTLLEAAGQAASGASGRSFGWINASFFLTPAHHHLRVAGIAAHHRLAQDLDRGLWDWPGCLWWENPSELDAMAVSLTALGYPLREVRRAELARLEPALTTLPDRALLFPEEGAVDAAALTRALMHRAADAGAELLFGLGAQALVTDHGAVCGALTAGGVIAADQVIVAAGTGSAALLEPLGHALPMLPRPGMLLTTRPAPRLLHHILALPEQDLRQDASGRLIAPLTAHHQADASAEPPQAPQTLVAEAMARLQALFKDVPLQVEQVALAHRPVPGDGLPAVGPVAPGLWLAVYHSGVTLAPLLTECLAAEVLGQAADPRLTAFRPARFWS